jgi:8-oxo-dGTP diphosphatase
MFASMPNTERRKQCDSKIEDTGPYVHVVAAAIVNREHEVLVTQRAKNTHQGGKWEFPGGKVERGESSVHALCRELYEELGITPVTYQPLIKTWYEYPEKGILLEVWRVERYDGIPEGREGQPLRWDMLEKLCELPFPEANLPILTALKLPERYLITPDPGADWRAFIAILDQALERGINLLRFRANSLDNDTYARHASQVVELCHDRGTLVLIDRDSDQVKRLGADGLHLPSRQLMSLNTRPMDSGHLICASCHNREELAHANRIAVDFVVLSPVYPTSSHSEVKGLGWESFEALCDVARMPVYALGGMNPDHVSQAKQCGGQGIAAIRSLWPANPV